MKFIRTVTKEMELAYIIEADDEQQAKDKARHYDITNDSYFDFTDLARIRSVKNEIRPCTDDDKEDVIGELKDGKLDVFPTILRR